MTNETIVDHNEAVDADPAPVKMRPEGATGTGNKHKRLSWSEPRDTKSVMAKSRELFENRIKNHEVDRLINPFSEFWGQNKDQYRNVLQNASAVWKDADKRTKLTFEDDKYGLPVAGTKTAARGHKARDFITNNIIEVCGNIKMLGSMGDDGHHYVTFGVLFKAYERINDKVVGLLLRARKHGLVEFPGEMLYQRQDEEVPIKLIKVPQFHELDLHYMTFKPNSKESSVEPRQQ